MESNKDIKKTERKPETSRFKAVAAIYLLLAFFALMFYFTQNKIWDDPSGDFLQNYVGAKTLRQDPAHLYILEKQRAIYELQGTNQVFLPYKNLPLTAEIFTPLTNLKLKDASNIWLLLNIVLFVTAGFIFTKDIKTTIFFFLGALLYFPFEHTLNLGQLNMLLLVALALTHHFFTKDKPILSGITASFLILKPVTLVLIPFLAMFYENNKYKQKFLLAVFFTTSALLFLNVALYRSTNLTSDFIEFSKDTNSQEFFVSSRDQFSVYDVIRNGLGRSPTQAIFFNAIGIAATIIFVTILEIHKEEQTKYHLILITLGIIFTMDVLPHTLLLLYPYLFIFIKDKMENTNTKALIGALLLYLTPFLAIVVINKYMQTNSIINLLLILISLYPILDSKPKLDRTT